MSYSAWRKSHVSAEQAAEAAYIEARVYEELLHAATKTLSQCEHALHMPVTLYCPRPMGLVPARSAKRSSP